MCNKFGNSYKDLINLRSFHFSSLRDIMFWDIFLNSFGLLVLNLGCLSM